MRVLIVIDNPFEMRNGRYYTFFSWPVFARNISKYIDHATLWAPVRKISTDEPVAGAPFEPGRLEIIENYYYTKFLDYYLTYLYNCRRLNQQAENLIRNHDVSLVRIPSPIAPLIMKHSIQLRKPFVLFAVGNIATSSSILLMSKGVKRAIYQLLVKVINNQENKCARKASLVYAYGEELAMRFRKFCPNVKIMQDGIISEKDIFLRNDTCTGNTIQLLRICWLVPCKGLEYLFEAVRLLSDLNLPVRLKIIGKEMDQRYAAHLRKIVQELGISNRVEFVGWIPHSDIFKAYRGSDIQVISSIGEGIPRVILEGAANGLPLVCTSVGGCPSVVHNGENGILVPPRDPAALAEGIKLVIRDGKLRRKIILGGYEMAKRNSSEVICQQIVKDFNEIVKGKLYVV